VQLLALPLQPLQPPVLRPVPPTDQNMKCIFCLFTTDSSNKARHRWQNELNDRCNNVTHKNQQLLEHDVIVRMLHTCMLLIRHF